MRARGNKHFGPAERFGKIFAFLSRQTVFQFEKVIAFFLFDVLGKIFHESFKGSLKLRIGRLHILESLELFFDLQGNVSHGKVRTIKRLLRGALGDLCPPLYGH